MSTESIAIGIFITIVCILPFIFMYLGNTKKEKKNKQVLQLMSQKHDCQIDEYEIYDSIIIGLDKQKKALIFIKKTEDKDFEQYINLNEVATCYPNKVLRSVVVDGKRKNDVIDRVELCLEGNSKNSSSQTLELYNEKDDVQLRSEILLCNKWSNIINTHLKAS